MLLNEFLKEHQKVDQQGRKIDGLEAQILHQRREFQTTISQLQAALKEQAAQIQKVSAQIALRNPAPRAVLPGNTTDIAMTERVSLCEQMKS